MNSKSINEIQVVIFDVDGTLYDQSKLRRIMMLSLFKYYVFRPWKFKELVILHHFRKERELNSGRKFSNLEREQYLWCETKTGQPVELIKKVINKWIFDYPNKYIGQCIYPGVKEFFNSLEKKGIKRAIYSDYKANDKLNSMNLTAELLVSSTDSEINALKPLPDGLNFIIKKLEVKDKSKCLFIGDRLELDGICAEEAGVTFLLVDKSSANHRFYSDLSDKLMVNDR